MQSTDLFCLDFWLEPGAQGGGGDAYDRSGGGMMPECLEIGIVFGRLF